MAFRALQAPAVGLPGVSGGIHYFIVCIHDDRVPINPIPHKYLIEPDGTIGHNNFAGLTRQERDDYGRLMIARKEGPGDRDRLNEIPRKMGKVYYPPKDSIYALMCVLPKSPPNDLLSGSLLGRATPAIKLIGRYSLQ
jgi:hypothetical protein